MFFLLRIFLCLFIPIIIFGVSNSISITSTQPINVVWARTA